MIAGDNTVIFVAGRKGSGKSTLVREISHEFPRVVALDSLGEYDTRERFQVLDGPQEIAEGMLRVEGAQTFRVSLRADDTETLLRALDLVYEMPGVLVIVEETSLYCSPSHLPPEISRLVRYGRHRDISQVYVARRPSEIHRDLTAQADVIVSFVQHEQRDVAYLRAVAGPEAEAVQRLPRFRFMAWGDQEKFPAAVLAGQTRAPQIALDFRPSED